MEITLMPIEIRDNNRRCDFCRGEMDGDIEFDLSELDDTIKETINQAGYFKLCLECAEPIIEVLPTRKGSFYACPFLRQLESDTTNIPTTKTTLDRLGLVLISPTVFPVPDQPIHDRLELLKVVTRHATDSFADKRRKMIQSFLIQGLTRPLSTKQRKVIHRALDIIGEDIKNANH